MITSPARVLSNLGLALVTVGSWACTRPPPSQFPTAEAALSRMRESYACSRAVTGEGEIDYFGDEGRFRGVRLVYTVAQVERLRLDLLSSFGIVLSTLTTDGNQLSFYDLREKTFLRGAASECNVALLTQVPVPPFVLVQLLRGEAPVLVHEPHSSSIRWDDGYQIEVPSHHAARQRIVLEPIPEDFEKPWQEQRLYVREVQVEQAGVVLYRARLDEHQARALAQPAADPDGLEADIPPSGPMCDARVPGRVRLEVPYLGRDIVITLQDIEQNPPLMAGVFNQVVPDGVRVLPARCR